MDRNSVTGPLLCHEEMKFIIQCKHLAASGAIFHCSAPKSVASGLIFSNWVWTILGGAELLWKASTQSCVLALCSRTCAEALRGSAVDRCRGPVSHLSWWDRHCSLTEVGDRSGPFEHQDSLSSFRPESHPLLLFSLLPCSPVTAV